MKTSRTYHYLSKAITATAVALSVLLAGCQSSELDVPKNKNGSKPNIIVILTDDQGYQDIGVFGSPDIKTPRLDQMAEEGMMLTDFHAAAAICSASRAALLTGKYPHRVGVPGVFFPNESHKGLDPKHETIAEVLKTTGYNTMAVGKWHLGDALKFLPTRQGFDDYFGIPYSNDMSPSRTMNYAKDAKFFDGYTPEKIEQMFIAANNNNNPPELRGLAPLMRGEEGIELPVNQEFLTQRYTDESIKFIDQSVQQNKPFFLYLAHSMPHVPLYASEKFKGKSERGLYGDVIEEMDFHTGRLLDHLKAKGIDQNTVVIFTSDNGPWLEKGEEGGSALPLYEGKFSMMEGGHRVPTIIRWPETIPAGVKNTEVVSMMDLLPTFAAWAGVEAELAEDLDGKNVSDLVTVTSGVETPHEYLYFGTTGVRYGKWKYHSKERYTSLQSQRPERGETLYDLNSDVGEVNNLIGEYPEIAALLKRKLAEHNQYIKN